MREDYNLESPEEVVLENVNGSKNLPDQPEIDGKAATFGVHGQ